MFTASENEIKKHNSVKSLQEKFQNYLQCPKGFFFHESIPGSGLHYMYKMDIWKGVLFPSAEHYA